MAYNDVTSIQGALKELYDGQELEMLVYGNNPALAMIKKNEDFYGEWKPIPMQYACGQGASADFATAQANQSANAFAKFLLTRVTNYSLGTITGEAAFASEETKGAFLNGFKNNIDSAIRTCTNDIARQIFGDGTGVRGTIKASTGMPGSGVLVLSNPDDIVFFEVNMVLQAATGTSAPHAALGYVIAVNRPAGQLTVSAVAAGGVAGDPSGWVAGDVLYRQGDRNACMSGFPAWLPSSVPTAGVKFFNVDRYVDSRLYGVYYDGSGESIEEALISASALVGREGGHITHAFMPFASWAALEKSLSSRVVYVDWKGPAGIAFQGIRLATPTGHVEVYADRNCTAKTCYMLQFDTWALESLGKAPRILDLDTLEVLRVGSADAYEVRVASYSNVSCNAPAWNARVLLAQ